MKLNSDHMQKLADI